MPRGASHSSRTCCARVAAVPGVAAVGLNTGLHPLGNMWTAADVAGTPPSAEPVVVHHINAGYTPTFGIRLAAGRLFTRHGRAIARGGRPRQRAVRAHAVRRTVHRSGRSSACRACKDPPFGLTDDGFEIVGVVHDVANDGLVEPGHAGDLPAVHRSPASPNLLVVRTTLDPRRSPVR